MGRTTDIRKAVQNELDDDPLIDADGVTVRNIDGDVILQGQVPSYPAYQESVEAAWRIPGVTSVRNHLQVVLAPENYRDDAMLTTSANNALAASTAVPDGVEAIAKDGNVTLSGLVDYRKQRLAAAAAVSGITGVRNIEDQIQVAYDVDPADVNQLVSDALDRQHVPADNRHVSASVNEDTVVLVGNVYTQAQRDAVIAAAWQAHGVVVVVDELELTG